MGEHLNDREAMSRLARHLGRWAEVIDTAEREHDGHLTVMRFTTHWKAFYGTPDLDDRERGRMFVAGLPAYPTMEQAIASLLDSE
jgi:hypothetical protein